MMLSALNFGVGSIFFHVYLRFSYIRVFIADNTRIDQNKKMCLTYYRKR